MTEKQKEQFLNITGREYNGIDLEGRFSTKYPYNNKDWKNSPFSVKFKYLEDYKLLCIQLSNRMTNMRAYTFDVNGKQTQDKRFIEYRSSGDATLKVDDKDLLKLYEVTDGEVAEIETSLTPVKSLDEIL